MLPTLGTSVITVMKHFLEVRFAIANVLSRLAHVSVPNPINQERWNGELFRHPVFFVECHELSVLIDTSVDLTLAQGCTIEQNVVCSKSLLYLMKVEIGKHDFSRWSV